MRNERPPTVSPRRTAVPPLCSTALALVGPGKGRTAVVVGCAAGAEATALLELGWTVIGIDEDPATCDAVRARAGTEALDRLTLVAESLPQLSGLPDADLVHVRSALLRSGSEQLWAHIQAALRPDGLVAVRLGESNVSRLRGWETLSERWVAPHVLEVVARRR
ncbi:class I SAM-dependent methyltransferase [Mumia sp. zg.B53]|uniref:methyltransferase domain-containing protein n=1 Tax=unclassified Mumia TaxID=2621872 RepID=UPI001C6F14F2|nr:MULTISPECIES: methyltransferase domain-containing protein [unclassified Mumia]MBW9205061.1 class I SAM-dependent methyltransferase [Mumia sp. zg.B17]MBW9208935.1 class I SAM-dependent methyltransferase [Mumia sp. zg.B21]MBW9213547.1 class I SAM-dependent methyltransferase [Mumia sp. zg.B53]